MFNTQQLSLVSALAKCEEDTLIKKIDTQFLQDNGEFVEGNVLFKVMPLRTSFHSLVRRSHVIIKRDRLLNRYRWRSLFDDVTNNIITTNTPMTLKPALEHISNLYTALGDTLYGVLLIDKSTKTRINPLHPLTAMSLLNDPVMQSNLYTIAIYTYLDRAAMDKTYETDSADTGIIEENLTDLINCYLNRKPTGIRVIGKTYDANSRQVSINYQVQRDKDEDPEYLTNIVTHQLLTAGTIAPYYGSSVIRRKHSTDSVSGMTVSPMLSSNISYSSTNYDNEETPIEKVKPSFGAVCTGSRNNRTAHGLRSLTHSNTKSPYNTSIIQSGALAYVDACIAKSLSIYKLAKLIEEPTNEQPDSIPKTVPVIDGVQPSDNTEDKTPNPTTDGPL